MKKIGMRTVKTGISVTICAILSPFIVQNPSSSAVACLLSMQDTVSGSLSIGLNRIIGTIFGGIIGFIILSIFPGSPIFCGLGVILTIHACNVLNLNKSISIACITFITIQMGYPESLLDAFYYSFNKVLDTCVGVVISIVVNFSLARPNYLKSLYENFEKIESDINNYLKFKILGEENKFDLEKFMENINTTEELYTKLIEEVGYHKGNININKVNSVMKLCREVNFHIQSIELLNKKLYLSQDTYNNLIQFYNEEDIIFELKENESPVFNYHLMKTIECSKKIRTEINLNIKKNKKNNKN